MRILYLLTSAEVGGAERFVLTLMRNRRDGDEVGLLVLLDRAPLSAELDQAADWVRYLAMSPSSRRLDQMVTGLKDAVRDFRPDVVSSHLFHTDLVLALAGLAVPKTTSVHTQGFGSGDLVLTKSIARTVGLLSGRFDAVIPSSDSLEMTDFIRRYRYRNVVPVIRNAAEVPYAPAWEASSRTFVSLSRNHPVKGHGVLFAAAAPVLREHSEWTLDCYGAGIVPDDERMLELLADSDARDLLEAGRIRLLGPTTTPSAVLATASALVISSTYGESFPIVGAEACALGVPVITTELGSTPEFVHDPAFLVAPGDPAALSEALAGWVDATTEHRASLSAVARATAVDRFSAQRVVASYADVFETVIAARRP